MGTGFRRHCRSLLVAALASAVPAPAIAATLDGQTTAGIPIAVTGKGDRIGGNTSARLKAGLDALASGDVAQARAIRDSLRKSALDRHILAWAIALKGSVLVPSTDIAAAAETLRAWPGAEAFRRNSERALLREKPSPQVVIKAFGGIPPLTAQGVIILARSHVALGDLDGARAVLSWFWRTEKLEAAEEVAIIGEFGAVIPAEDHRIRMERMLYAGRVKSAGRVAAVAGAKSLFDAWSAVARNDKAAGKLLDAVPAAQRDAGYLFAKARYLRRSDKIAEAAAVVLKAPKDRAALIDPDAWWIERRAISRELVDQGDIKTAYKVAAAHAAESAVNQADAEFHAGWYALRGLSDAKTASEHFTRIAEAADGPISLARAYYWLGRAAEAGGPGSARIYYERASTYGTSFYGQLAAAKIGRATINAAAPIPSEGDRKTFAAREAVRAIQRLESAGYANLADRLYRELAGQLTSPGELALLTALAESRGNHFLALKVAKAAAGRGIEIGVLSHPVGAIPSSANISGSGKALAYAIARQESEFNVGAVSGAGARGLLQLMPDTARDVAKKAGLAFSSQKLTTDAGYNATLGAAFLGEQLGRFSGSYVLTFAGYNAGPGRAREWIKRYGDPRGKDLETVVDWIERIPFAETRSYVQRVMENYQVYKMRLTGSFDIARDLVDGR
ncbi:lytic transglycosylase domain-containing protein [Mesorhizobium sp. LHD-90]|uniref:lytic transglycosylase domain-containing protein n=1 Tax=Mesorhizobium sp. LHD-90 TaxID=3071414 RepID=UPI0027DF3838|nr:lytic transglycosylase domain-containing protein [Mesorhizobium sp. LHD-90]MDQ6438022.1 lytic transglycosylase domain-containing protein [Mesorhizobium sp. LHD-90]